LILKAAISLCYAGTGLANAEIKFSNNEKENLSMKHRERVEMVFNHEVPDRIPYQATFTPEFADRLRKELKITNPNPHDPHNGRWNTYELEIATGQDAFQCSIGWVTGYYMDTKPYVDEWGVQWAIQDYETPYGKGYYTELRDGPLKDAEAIDSYQPPDPHRPEIYRNLQRLIREHKDEYYIIGRLHTTIWETAWALRGFQQMLLELVLDPDLVNRVLDIPYNYHMVVAKKMAEMGVDMVWLGDDMGGQNNMLMSPETWRQFFKQRMATIIAEVKSINPNIKVAYHTDGNNYPIIPDLIEIGLDVLNPIQAECMDPAQLKKDFGNNLCFFGAIDVQKTLPFGTPAAVEAEVLEGMRIIGKGGGWLCAPNHHIQLDTPIENFWALVNAIKKTPYTSK
jgi:uroporphyrinogen decarboxylase